MGRHLVLPSLTLGLFFMAVYARLTRASMLEVADLDFVRTGRARSKIRHYLKNMEQEESRDLGEKMLAQAIRAEGMHLPGSEPPDAALWQQLTRWSGNRHRGDLLIDIGLGDEPEGGFELCRELGCTQVQGYLFGKPMPPEEATRLVCEEVAV